MKLKEIKFPNTIETLIEAEMKSINRVVTFKSDHKVFTKEYNEALFGKDRKAYNAARKEWVKLNLKYAAPFLDLIEDEEDKKQATKEFSKHVRPGANYISGLYHIFF